MLPNLEIKPCSFCQGTNRRAEPTLRLDGHCVVCDPTSRSFTIKVLKELFIEFQELEQDLQTERATTQQAHQTSQTKVKGLLAAPRRSMASPHRLAQNFVTTAPCGTGT